MHTAEGLTARGLAVVDGFFSRCAGLGVPPPRLPGLQAGEGVAAVVAGVLTDEALRVAKAIFFIGTGDAEKKFRMSVPVCVVQGGAG